jgi:mono/diheme cytochrome c family protein
MRTILKFIGVAVILLAVAAAGGLSYLMFALPDVPVDTTARIEVTADALARGAYLNNHVMGCTTCHAQRDWTKFSGPAKPGTIGRGGDEFDLGPAGVLYAKNITPAAIGSWSDGELLRAVTAGVSRDGTPLFPLMPYPHFGRMAKEDVNAVLAYVRAMAPIDGDVRPRRLSFPLNLIVRTIPSPASPQPRPSPENKLAYGKYMTEAALCTECHTPIDDRGQKLPGRDFAGGMLLLETGYRVYSANITPDADTGIGTWTEQQFIDKFKGFEAPSDAVLSEADRRENTPMPWTAYAGMTREDLSAIYTYIRTLKPIVNRVTKFPDAE